MKTNSLSVAGIIILTVQLVFLPWSTNQAQDFQATPTLQQPTSTIVLLPPVDLQTSTEVLPAPAPQAAPLCDRTIFQIADLEAIAIANNPTIVQADQRIAALQGKHLQVGLHPNPILAYRGEEMGEEGKAGKQGLVVGQRIITANKLGLNRAIVSHEIQQAQQERKMQRLRVLNSVHSRTYITIIAQRTITLSEQLVKIGDESVKAAEELHKAKEVSMVDVLQARVEANSAKLALNNARNDYQATWQRLAVVMGVAEMPPKPLIDNLVETIPELHWNDCVDSLMTQSPQLVRAWSNVEQAKCTLARAQAGRKPDIDLGGVVQYNNALDDTEATIEVGIPLQIYNRNQGNIRKACAELAEAKQEVRRIELVLQDRLAEVFKQYSNARQQTEQYKTEILPDAQSSLDLVRQGYQQSEFGYLELLTAQRTYFRVNLAYLESLRQLWINSVELKGFLLTDGLESSNR